MKNIIKAAAMLVMIPCIANAKELTLKCETFNGQCSGINVDQCFKKSRTDFTSATSYYTLKTDGTMTLTLPNGVSTIVNLDDNNLTITPEILAVHSNDGNTFTYIGFERSTGDFIATMGATQSGLLFNAIIGKCKVLKTNF